LIRGVVRHCEAGFEASGCDHDLRMVRMRAKEKALVSGTGAQAGPALDDLGPVKSGTDRGCPADQVFELIIGRLGIRILALAGRADGDNVAAARHDIETISIDQRQIIGGCPVG